VGDFDRDGALDAAVTSDQSVSVLLNVTRRRDSDRGAAGSN
jgi:hypothetical protein